jgi:adenine-specific DNA-methyltransferase
LGVKTGFNEAFIIDTETRNRILANCRSEQERKRTEEIIKPVLRGRDIDRYRYKWAGLWIIIHSSWHFPLHHDTPRAGASLKARRIISKRLFQHSITIFMQFFKDRSLGKGIKGFLKRDDQGDYWWAVTKMGFVITTRNLKRKR